MSTKKEINALKDKAHKDLEYYQSQPPTAENRQEILDIQNYLQDLDKCYPQFKGYLTPKERRFNDRVGAVGFAFVLFIVVGGLLNPSIKTTSAPGYASDVQQSKDALNRARGTY